ncbi:MAG: hypothetical protein HN578_09380, partial [Rhodospirillales bacterium]|nr:hypothetical protein [Rhodospirillales bacterium]
ISPRHHIVETPQTNFPWLFLPSPYKQEIAAIVTSTPDIRILGRLVSGQHHWAAYLVKQT